MSTIPSKIRAPDLRGSAPRSGTAEPVDDLDAGAEKAIGTFRIRVAGLLTLRECLRWSFVWIMIWAGAVVAVRALALVDRSTLLWGLVGLGAALVLGTILGVRRTPSRGVLRAVLDGRGSLGGLLMTAGDQDVGEWGPQIRQVRLPGLRWRAGPQAMRLAGSLIFLGAAFLLPDRYFPPLSSSLQLGAEVQRLTEQLEALKQDQIVPPEKAEVLEKDLQRAARESLARDPAKTMESIDHLEQSFRKAAAEAVEKAIQKTEFAAGAEELAASLQKAQGQIDAKQLGEAMKSLGHMLQQAAEQDQSLSESLSKELQDACERGDLSSEQLKELSEALKHCKACELAKLDKLLKARLVDVTELRRCEGAGKCDKEALIAALCDDKDEKPLADLLLTIEAPSPPGRGGISRGRADAAMTWSQGTEKGDAAFKEQALPAGAVSSMKESRLVGLSAGDPTSSEPGGRSTGGALQSASAGSGEARAQTILPEHGRTVQRYFERGKP